MFAVVCLSFVLTLPLLAWLAVIIEQRLTNHVIPVTALAALWAALSAASIGGILMIISTGAGGTVGVLSFFVPLSAAVALAFLNGQALLRAIRLDRRGNLTALRAQHINDINAGPLAARIYYPIEDDLIGRSYDTRRARAATHIRYLPGNPRVHRLHVPRRTEEQVASGYLTPAGPVVRHPLSTRGEGEVRGAARGGEVSSGTD